MAKQNHPTFARPKWRVDQVAKIKRSIKRELDQAESEKGSKARLETALLRVAELENDESSNGELRRFVYLMSALVHHEKSGGMTRPQVERAQELAAMLLTSNGIKPGKSALAFLHGELHLILSLIHRKDGAQWLAAWEQQIVQYASGNESPGGRNFQSLSMANRALRLGHLQLATQEYNVAMHASDLTDRAREQALLGYVKSLRLSYSDSAIDSARTAKKDFNLSTDAQLEWNWEIMCFQARETGDIGPLVSAVKKGASHNQASYLVEALLWSRATETRKWAEALPACSTLRRSKLMDVKGTGVAFTAATILEECYNFETPLMTRIQNLGGVLASISNVSTIDKELLIWAASARFLARAKAFNLAKLVLAEYQALCLRLSFGKSTDVLGIMADMEDRDWTDLRKSS